jgi:nitrite reductase/ring-hydroxylating ferredoxin subunit
MRQGPQPNHAVRLAEQPLCEISDLAEGSARGFAVEGLREKVIVLRKDGHLHGYLDACPHYAGGTPMAWKTDAYLNGAGTHLACHSHGALFDPTTGICVLGPCLGQGLTRVELHITATGEVFAAI